MSQKRIKVRSPKRRQRGPKYWVAMGTLAAYTTFGGKFASRAYAQQTSGTLTAQTSPPRSDPDGIDNETRRDMLDGRRFPAVMRPPRSHQLPRILEHSHPGPNSP